jgi:hypothetical protein
MLVRLVYNSAGPVTMLTTMSCSSVTNCILIHTCHLEGCTTLHQLGNGRPGEPVFSFQLLYMYAAVVETAA